MTRDRAADLAVPDALGPTTRLLVAVPVAVLLGLVALISLSLTGWGLEQEPAAQLRRDASRVVLSGIAGAAAGATLVWGLVGRRTTAVGIAALLGAVPALVMVTAYFTDAY